MKKKQSISESLNKQNHFSQKKLFAWGTIICTLFLFVSSCEKNNYSPEKEESPVLLDVDSTVVKAIDKLNLKSGGHNYVYMHTVWSYHSDAQKTHYLRFKVACTNHAGEVIIVDDNAPYYHHWVNHSQNNSTYHNHHHGWKCPKDSHEFTETWTEPHLYNHATDPNYCTECGYRRWP